MDFSHNFLKNIFFKDVYISWDACKFNNGNDYLANEEFLPGIGNKKGASINYGVDKQKGKGLAKCPPYYICL